LGLLLPILGLDTHMGFLLETVENLWFYHREALTVADLKVQLLLHVPLFFLKKNSFDYLHAVVKLIVG